MCNAYEQDVDLMSVYCWTIICYAVLILNRYLICFSCLQDRYIERKYLITNPASKGTLTQHWLNAGPPSTALAQHLTFNIYCFVFTGIHNQRLAINYWLLRAFSKDWRQIDLFAGVSAILTCQILITFMSDGSVLQESDYKNPFKLRT